MTTTGTYACVTLSNAFLTCNDVYDKSPESSLIPTALNPNSFSANATAQKHGIPLLEIKHKRTDYETQVVIL